MLCYEEQILPQSAGSHTIGTPPPSTEITGGLRGLAAHLQDSIKIRIQAKKDGSNGTIIGAKFILYNFTKSHIYVKFQLTIKCMLVLLPIFLCAYRDKSNVCFRYCSYSNHFKHYIYSTRACAQSSKV